MIIVRSNPKYSERFKRQIVEEIQSGSISIDLPPFGRHVKKVLNYLIGGVNGIKKQAEVQ